MRALFWIFPSILSIGKKGEMVRRTKKELGDTALRMLKDAKVAGDASGKTLMVLMRECFFGVRFCQCLNRRITGETAPKQQMDEEHIVAQLRTIISAGYETISAAAAVSCHSFSDHPLSHIALH
jgi:cytochrome P450